MLRRSLSLAREALADLTTDELGVVVGGSDTCPPSNTCPESYTCPDSYTCPVTVIRIQRTTSQLGC